VINRHVVFLYHSKSKGLKLFFTKAQQIV